MIENGVPIQFGKFYSDTVHYKEEEVDKMPVISEDDE